MLITACRGTCGIERDWWQLQAVAAVVEDGLGGTSADACDTELAAGEECIKVADAAGSFDLHVWAGVLPHQPQVVHGGTAGAVTCGCLDPVRLQLGADFAESNFLCRVQIAVLEDDFDFGVCCMGLFDHGLQVAMDVVPVAADDTADVADEVEFFAAVCDSLP